MSNKSKSRLYPSFRLNEINHHLLKQNKDFWSWFAFSYWPKI